ncbi:rCG34616 [Rattus norvegicus]|uniref:RCG34616 n=1 Tax=Rattus norvegicus TaxID=10116 RepID=A6HHP5_RAT|nr:rCG34616 [Rattus norvegicus]
MNNLSPGRKGESGDGDATWQKAGGREGLVTNSPPHSSSILHAPKCLAAQSN